MSGLMRDRVRGRLDDIRPRDSAGAGADPVDGTPLPRGTRGRDTVLTRARSPSYGARRTAMGGAL